MQVLQFKPIVTIVVRQCLEIWNIEYHCYFIIEISHSYSECLVYMICISSRCLSWSWNITVSRPNHCTDLKCTSCLPKTLLYVFQFQSTAVSFRRKYTVYFTFQVFQRNLIFFKQTITVNCVNNFTYLNFEKFTYVTDLEKLSKYTLKAIIRGLPLKSDILPHKTQLFE